MRAARLLQMLLMLQNRGRMTAPRLAEELEVSPRTILRDVDALTEAGLPVIVHQGNQGGIELGFDYRTRLTGLATDEAEALAVMLDHPSPVLVGLGLAGAGRRAAAKLNESLPRKTRETMHGAREMFPARSDNAAPDPRLPALAGAVRARTAVWLACRSSDRVEVHPVAIGHDGADWFLSCQRSGKDIPRDGWGDVNITAVRFEAQDSSAFIGNVER